MADDNPNGKKPPESLHFERSAVQCPKCKRVIYGLILEEIDGLIQLRLGDNLVETLKSRCLHCGQFYNWTPAEKVLRQMAADYRELLLLVNKNYRPE